MTFHEGVTNCFDCGFHDCKCLALAEEKRRSIAHRKTSSWLLGNHVCGECGHPVVVTQAYKLDYLFYCASKFCKNHHPGVETGDQDPFPDFIQVDQ